MRTYYEHQGKACGSTLSKQMIAASDADTAYSPLLIRYLKAAFSDSPSEPLDHLFTNSDCNRRPSFWIEKKYERAFAEIENCKIEEIEIKDRAGKNREVYPSLPPPCSRPREPTGHVEASPALPDRPRQA